MTGRSGVRCLEADDEAGVGPGAARRDDEVIEGDALIEALGQQLLGAGDIAERAARVRSPAGNGVAEPSGGDEVGKLGGHRGGKVAAPCDDGDALDAHQVEQQVVAAGIGAVAAGHALLDDEAALEALADRGGKCQAAVVRLRRADRDERVGSLGERVGDEELELARLIAAAGEAEQVVALEPQLGATEVTRQVRQRFERGRAGGIAAARKAGEVHRPALERNERAVIRLSHRQAWPRYAGAKGDPP